uniref:Venom serpin 6 n=1 Tax=Lethocerus distinctifemur TaxID=280095 RepID=A0A2K8JNT0_9HEMI|nr:venom serpin 6 [Lethocerus distinctifemur]
MARILIPGLLLAALAFSNFAFCKAYNNNSEVVAAANNKFATELYKLLARDAKGENVFFSPFSISLCMAMVYLMSEGETSMELAQVFHYSQNREELAISFQQALAQLDPSTISWANNLFIDDNFQVKKSYKDFVSKYLGAASENLDFKKSPEKSRTYINQWVSTNTKGKITNLLERGSIDAHTAMVLASVLYFKGEWLHGFKTSWTQKRDFQLLDGTKKKVEMMTAEHSDYGFADMDNAIAVQIPYKANQSMVIIMPKEYNGLQRLEDQLIGKDLFLNVVNKLYRGFEIQVTMPKFKIEDTFNLRGTLKEMGLNKIFTPGKAELTRGSDDPRLFLSGVYHKTAIETNEDGTVAAAATGAVSAALSAPLRVIIDRPFLFSVFDTQTKNIIFFGRMTKPNLQQGR